MKPVAVIVVSGLVPLVAGLGCTGCDQVESHRAPESGAPEGSRAGASPLEPERSSRVGDPALDLGEVWKSESPKLLKLPEKTPYEDEAGLRAAYLRGYGYALSNAKEFGGGAIICFKKPETEEDHALRRGFQEASYVIHDAREAVFETLRRRRLARSESRRDLPSPSVPE